MTVKRSLAIVLCCLLVLSVGCMATEKREPTTLGEWGELQRAQF